eukprot:Gb_20849 [translate_table: standard]
MRRRNVKTGHRKQLCRNSMRNMVEVCLCPNDVGKRGLSDKEECDWFSNKRWKSLIKAEANQKENEGDEPKKKKKCKNKTDLQQLAILEEAYEECGVSEEEDGAHGDYDYGDNDLNEEADDDEHDYHETEDEILLESIYQDYTNPSEALMKAIGEDLGWSKEERISILCTTDNAAINKAKKRRTNYALVHAIEALEQEHALSTTGDLNEEYHEQEAEREGNCNWNELEEEDVLQGIEQGQNEFNGSEENEDAHIFSDKFIIRRNENFSQGNHKASNLDGEPDVDLSEEDEDKGVQCDVDPNAVGKTHAPYMMRSHSFAEVLFIACLCRFSKPFTSSDRRIEKTIGMVRRTNARVVSLQK